MSHSHRLLGLPTPFAGTALGISSLGVGLSQISPWPVPTQTGFALVALIFWILIGTRYVRFPHSVIEDLRHQVLCGIVPTFSMCTMVLSSTLRIYAPTAGIVMWFIGAGLHCFLLTLFFYFRLQTKSMKEMAPSWFVPPVGILVACLTEPPLPWIAPLMHMFLVFGLCYYAVFLPMMMYRLFFYPNLPEAAQPTLAILGAPASLSLAAYLTAVEHPHILVVAALFGIAACMTSIVYVSLWRLLHLPFSPGYAAYTFPLAIGPVALFKLSNFMLGYELLAPFAGEIRIMGTIEVVVAACVITYVTMLKFKHLPRFLKKKTV